MEDVIGAVLLGERRQIRSYSLSLDEGLRV